MKRQMLALMDSDPGYAVAFMNCTNRRRSSPFSVCAFTKWDDLMNFLGSHRIDVLLVSESDAKKRSDDLRQLAGRLKIIFLSEEPESAHKNDSQVIWKYQPASGIMNKVMFLYGMAAPDPDGESLLKPRTEVIGIYSPVGRIGKTYFSMALADLLARNGNTLFLNLEAFPVFEDPADLSLEHPSGYLSSGPVYKEYPGKICPAHNLEESSGRIYSAHGFEKSPKGTSPDRDSGSDQNSAPDANGGLSDLLYYLLREEPNLNARLLSLVRTDTHEAAFLTPSRHPSELMNLSEKDWFRLFQVIRRESPYESVVADLGTLPAVMPCLLEECDIIYMPTLSDHSSSLKTSLAEQNMLEYSEELSERLRIVDFSEAAGSGPSGSGRNKALLSDLAAECIRRDRL